jgi:glycosyltransferase involved in cell wall biosynthesis
VRIAYVAPSLDDTTGWGRWVNDLLRHVRREGVEPVVWAPRSAEQHAGVEGVADEFYFVLPELFDYLQSRRGLSKLGTIYRFFRSVRPAKRVELVHSLDAYPWGIYGHFLAQCYDVPHIITTHGRYGYIAGDRLLDRKIYERVLAGSDVVITVSQAVRRAIIQRFAGSIAVERVLTIQNPVDASAFPLSPMRASLRPTTDRPVLLSVTRFIPVKDIETAVLAFKRVRECYPDAEYYIVGPGNGPRNSYYQSIKALIEREAIAGLHIVGKVSKHELSTYYAKATLLLHTAMTLPDDFEASGLILLEAGLFGLPVVATHSGGIPEVVEDGITGLLVPERDPDALAKAVIRLVVDPPLTQKLGQANRKRALERNWMWYVPQQLAIYRKLVAL